MTPPAEETNLWQSIAAAPPAPGLYDVLLPSGKVLPATWGEDRWQTRDGVVEIVAWRRSGSSRSRSPIP